MISPDKIYTDNRGVYAKLPIFSQIDANVEYIRKDALLEWARLGLEMLDDDTSPVAQAAKAVFNGLIDKLNSM